MSDAPLLDTIQAPRDLRRMPGCFIEPVTQYDEAGLNAKQIVAAVQPLAKPRAKTNGRRAHFITPAVSAPVLAS